MVDSENYDFNIITSRTVKPEESFIDAYIVECFEYENTLNLIMQYVQHAECIGF